MTDMLIIIRNLVLATILAWLGLEFSPDSPDKQDDRPVEKVSILAISG
jgi:hypothetical protein